MLKIFTHLSEIYQCFGYDNISICGGLCDYYWINYTDLADIDLIVNTSAIIKYFNITYARIDIKKNGFDMKRRRSSKFIENFYQGSYYDTKIDLFLVDNITNLNREIISVDGSKLGLPMIQIDSPKQRIKLLNTHLNYPVSDKTEKWERDWIKFKKIKAEKKLFIYNALFPNI